MELSADDARVACGIRADRVSVAVSNGPRSTVLSGDPAPWDDVVARRPKPARRSAHFSPSTTRIARSPAGAAAIRSSW